MRHIKIAAVIIFVVLTAIASVSLALIGSLAASAQTQAEMNRQAARDAGKADAAMSAAYKKLAAVLSSPQKAQLQKAQRAWLVYRSAEADLLSSRSEGRLGASDGPCRASSRNDAGAHARAGAGAPRVHD